MADAYDQAAGSADADARAALAALAQAGTAGKQAYDQGQAQLQSAQQAAVSQALGKAQLIGGAEAFSPSFAQNAASSYVAGSRAMGEYNAQNNAGIAASNAINRNYMGQVKAGLGASRQLTMSDIMDKQMRAQDSLSNAEAKIQYQGAAENDAARIKRENTDKYWEAKNANSASQKTAKTATDPLVKNIARLDKDIAFFQNRLTELAPKSKSKFSWTGSGGGMLPVPGWKSVEGQSGPDARRYGQAKEQLNKLTAQRTAAASQLNAYVSSSLAPAQQLEKKLAQARATSIAQPDVIGLARQRAIDAGVDPDRARGLFGDDEYAKADAAAQKAAVKTFDEKNPDVKKFASTFGITRDEAVPLHKDYMTVSSQIDTLIKDEVDPTEAIAKIEEAYPDHPQIREDLIKKYMTKYDRKKKLAKDAE